MKLVGQCNGHTVHTHLAGFGCTLGQHSVQASALHKWRQRTVMSVFTGWHNVHSKQSLVQTFSRFPSPILDRPTSITAVVLAGGTCINTGFSFNILLTQISYTLMWEDTKLTMINDYCTSLNTTVAPSSLDYCNSVSYSISVEFSRTTTPYIWEVNLETTFLQQTV